ncbi:MAG: glycosyltransferase, partial [Armatimonadota bacterium]
MAAWNEEAVIARRIDNLLASDYPEDRLEIIIASDGSTDRTNEIVAEYAARDDRVRLLALEHRGKTGTVNIAVQEATGDVIVNTDASTHFEEDALRKLVSYLGEDGPDCVTGSLIMLPRGDTPYNRGEDIYRRFENLLRFLESKLGAGFHGSGACMAVRREHYPQIPENTSDDLSPTLALAAQGHKIVHTLEVRVVDYMD